MYNMYCFVHNIKNSRRNDHFFPAKVSPKSQKSSKKAYFVKICCPKGAGGPMATELDEKGPKLTIRGPIRKKYEKKQVCYC